MSEADLRAQLRKGKLTGLELTRRADQSQWYPVHDATLYSEEVAFEGSPRDHARLKVVRGFGIHFLVYLAVNVMIGFAAPVFLFWGIGIIVHGARAFPAAQTLYREGKLPYLSSAAVRGALPPAHDAVGPTTQPQRQRASTAPQQIVSQQPPAVAPVAMLNAGPRPDPYAPTGALSPGQLPSGDVPVGDPSASSSMAYEPTVGVGASRNVQDQHLHAQVRGRLFGESSAAPVQIGRYRLLEQIGAGGMGLVYRAHDDSLDRTVALKLLRSEVDTDTGTERLQREARSMAKVSHPHVVTVFDVGVYEGAVFVAMEYVQGRTLRRWLEDVRAVGDVLAVLRQAGEGLAAAHAGGLVHRDFKPENVIVGDDGRVRVLDFGMARSPGAPLLQEIDGEAQPLQALEPAITRTGMLAGTPGYMAPEQFEGSRVDAPADQFAFCIALREAIWGTRPFAGDTVGELTTSVVGGHASTFAGKPREGLAPHELDAAKAVVNKACAKDPDDRFESMRALLDAIRAVPDLATRSPRTSTTWKMAMGLSSFTLAGLGVAGLLSDDPSPQSPNVEAAQVVAAHDAEPTPRRCALGTELRNGTCLPIEWDPRFVQCDGDRCSIDRALLVGVGDRLPLIVRQARVVPTRNERGTPLGMKLFGVRKDTAAGMLGFENGDIIRTINDIKLDVDVSEFVPPLATAAETANTLTVVFERDGAVKESVVAVRDDRPSARRTDAAETLPIVRGELPALSDLPSVHVGTKTLVFDSMELATIADGKLEASQKNGHLILPLHDHLSERVMREGPAEGDQRIALYADASTPFSEVVDVLYSSGKAGFSVYEFVGQSGSGKLGALQVAPPLFPDAPGKREPLRVMVTAEGFQLKSSLIERLEGQRGVDAYDFAALAEATTTYRSEHASTRAVVSASANIRYEVLLRTLATLRGETCTTDPRTCLMTHLVIEAGQG